jgi:hypothetical protein
MFHRFVFVCAFVASALCSSALAGTRFVNVALATGANDGSSWADAHRTADGVSVALTAAVAGDEIWVAAGTYLPTVLGTRATAIPLKNGVTIYGGFAGSETSVAQRDIVLNPTILSGDLAGDDVGGILTDNSFHVVTGAGTNATAVLDGFTVRGGNANGVGGNQDRGGGILCMAGASPTVRRCTFASNRCTFGGGAGYINNSAPLFEDCVFENNFGGSFGGAFDAASNGSATFDRCVFRGNSAARAGALEIFSSSVKVSNSLFYSNTCTVSATGAGLRVSTGSPTVINCVFDQNTAAGGASGSAAQIAPATVSVTYSLIPAGYTGTGNLAATPIYDVTGPLPFKLASNSPGIDAGDNAGVIGGGFELSGAPRLLEVLAIPDTGSGAAPVVDIGAFELDGDCNANNVADWTDIALGASSDVNLNTVPDECECSGGIPPTVYCTAKFNSQFCLPAMSFQGGPSVSSASPFLLVATEILNNENGMLFYGYAVQALPFEGGTLCITAPAKRTSVSNSGGSPVGVDCSGAFTFDFNAHIQSGVDPLLVVGQQVGAQFWSRDPRDPFGSNLTDAVRFAICQ